VSSFLKGSNYQKKIDENLSSCPSCGGGDLELSEEQSVVSWIYYVFVRCRFCGKTGPGWTEKKKALDGWQSLTRDGINE